MAKKKTSTQSGFVYIGTSNVVIPGNKSTFPERFKASSRLHYYSHLFNSVEINSTFYKTPLRSTFEKWQEDVPAGFRFSIKLAKEFTHTKELKSDLSRIEPVLQAADGLSVKKGAMLIQFPGKITFEYFNQVEDLLQAVTESSWIEGWAIAVEFRDPSWYVGETREMLDQSKAALVLHDIPKSKMSSVMTASDNVYLRFHGPTGNYRDGYTEQFLKDRALEIAAWKKQGKTVFVYFNNTIGDAFQNARTLEDLLQGI